MDDAERRRRHQEARGKKIPTLSDLSRQEPTPEDIADLKRLLDKESDRGFALILAAYVETTLFWGIYRRMPMIGDKSRRETFEEKSAPLSSFSAKIIMGRAMGIYGDQTETMLNQVRSIRNAFAHTARIIDFTNPCIDAACYRIKFPKPLKPLEHLDSAKTRYNLACSILIHDIGVNTVNLPKRMFETHLP